MKNRNREFVQKREELEKVIARKAEEANKYKAKYEDAHMATKTLEHVIVRMRKDQIVYKQLGRVREEEVRRRVKDLKMLEEAIIQEDEKLHKLACQYNDFRRAYVANT